MNKFDKKKPRGQQPRGFQTRGQQSRESQIRGQKPGGPQREQMPADDDAGYIIVGKNPVSEALRSGQQVDKLFILKDNKDHVLGDLADKARKRGLVVQTVERVKLENMAGDEPHQGVAAMMAPFPFRTVEDVLALAASKGEEPLVVILDHITDPHNFGAIVRSANLCGAHGVIFPKRRSASVTAVSVKASSGAMSYTPLVKTGNLSQCIEDLKKRGFWIMAADMDGVPYYKNDMKGKLAIVIGSEGKGVSPKIKKECDFTTSIPLYGDIDSFNASAAASIILAEAAKQRH